MPQTAVRTGVTLNYEITGEGEPAAAHHGDVGVDPAVGRAGRRGWPRSYQVIAFDNRGLGGSERGEGQITVASLAEDASALLEALDIPRAHAHGLVAGLGDPCRSWPWPTPSRSPAAILYATWARCDGFQRAMLTALRHPWATRRPRVGAGARRGWPSPPSCSTTPSRGDDGGDAAGVPAERGRRCGSPSSSGTPTWCTTRWTGWAASPRRPWSSSASRTCSPRRGRRRRSPTPSRARASSC